MKLLIFNGSPRQGNTVEALKALREGLADYPEIEIQEIKAADCNIVPCTGCEA
jgi:multimeric flavodoxin WrbA